MPKISLLPTGTPVATDYIPYLADPATVPVTKRTLVSALAALLSGGMVKINENVVSVATPSITFSAIASTWTHLQIWVDARSSEGATTTQPILLNFNDDFGANYDYQTQYTILTAVTAQEAYAASLISVCRIPAGLATANYSGGGKIDIHDYKNTTFYKTAESYSGVMINNASDIWTWRSSGFWRNTAAITKIRLYAGGGNFVVGSKFSLYGIP